MSGTGGHPLLAEAIERTRVDPRMAGLDAPDRGACWDACNTFALVCAELGVPFKFRRWVNLPGYRTTRQHSGEVNGLIVDWTAAQHDPATSWPLVVTVEEYEALGFEVAPEAICQVCGTTGLPHECAGLRTDPWAEAIARLPRADRRKLERLMRTPPGRRKVEAMLARAGFTQ